MKQTLLIFVSLKLVILESLSQTFQKPKMFPLIMSTEINFFLVFPLFTLFSGIQIAISRNGQKQTKCRFTIDKALEVTYHYWYIEPRNREKSLTLI